MTRVEGLAVDPDTISGPLGKGFHLLPPVFWIYIIAFAPHPSRSWRGGHYPGRDVRVPGPGSAQGSACEAGAVGAPGGRSSGVKCGPGQGGAPGGAPIRAVPGVWH